MYVLMTWAVNLILYQATGHGQHNFANIDPNWLSVCGIALRYTNVLGVVIWISRYMSRNIAASEVQIHFEQICLTCLLQRRMHRSPCCAHTSIYLLKDGKTNDRRTSQRLVAINTSPTLLMVVAQSVYLEFTYNKLWSWKITRIPQILPISYNKYL